jgi:hypothetical protein
MKKLTLKLDDLEVTSFAAQDEREGAGTVKGMEFSMGNPWSGCYECPSYIQTQCGWDCTQVDGCYPSYYCSDIGPGMPNASCAPGCMTDNYANC